MLLVVAVAAVTKLVDWYGAALRLQLPGGRAVSWAMR